MISAKEAGELSLRCVEYKNKLDNYKICVECAIRNTARIGRTVVGLELQDDIDKYSIARDLGKILKENGFKVKVCQSPNKYELKIAWEW